MTPRLFCESCGRMVGDAEKAVYVYDVLRAENPSGTEIFVVHKGDCRRSFLVSGLIPGDNACWDELMYLPIRLGGNIGIEMPEDWERAWEKASQ
jgi:hypothetical protein